MKKLILALTLFISLGFQTSLLKGQDFTGKWQLTKIVADGSEVTDINEFIGFQHKEGKAYQIFEKDGKFTSVLPGGSSYEGNWRVKKNKLKLSIYAEGNLTTIRYKILQKTDEMYEVLYDGVHFIYTKVTP